MATNTENVILNNTDSPNANAVGIIAESKTINQSQPDTFTPDDYEYENGTTNVYDSVTTGTGTNQITKNKPYWRIDLDMDTGDIDPDDASHILTKSAAAKSFLVAETSRLKTLSDAVDAYNDVKTKFSLKTSMEKKEIEGELMTKDTELERIAANLELMQFKRKQNRIVSEAVLANLAKEIVASATVASEKKSFDTLPDRILP